MAKQKSLHSICRWTFNPGKGGFVPADMRPEWGKEFTTVDFVNLVGEKIAPKLPKNVQLGIEVHYDGEINEKTAKAEDMMRHSAMLAQNCFDQMYK
jgi:xylose isomerase